MATTKTITFGNNAQEILLDLTTNGTLTLSKDTDLSRTADNKPALIIGNRTGVHMEFDTNEITAKSNGTTPTELYLNNDGGTILTGGNINIRNNNIILGTTPNINTYTGLTVADRGGAHNLGSIRHRYLGTTDSSGNSNGANAGLVSMVTSVRASNGNEFALTVNHDGTTGYAALSSSPTKATSNTHIATTKFVHDVAADYLPLSGGTVTGGLKTNSYFIMTDSHNYIRSSTYQKDTKMSADHYINIAVQDKDSEQLGWIGYRAFKYDTTSDTDNKGQVGTIMSVRKPGGDNYGSIGVYSKNGEIFAATSMSPDKDNNSTRIATTEYTRNYVSSYYLAKTGGTVTGATTFTNKIFLKHSTINLGTKPSTEQWLQQVFIDKDGDTLGHVSFFHGTDNTNGIRISSNNAASAAGGDATYMTLGHDASGNKICTIHTGNFLIENGYGRARPYKAGSGTAPIIVTQPDNTNYYMIRRIYKNGSKIYFEWLKDANYTVESWSVTATASDICLKKNIKDSDIDALQTLNKIKIRSFDWKEDNKHWGIGMIADELEQLDSNFVSGGDYNEEGIREVKTVDHWYLTGYLVKGIQELSQKVKNLETEIKSLKKEEEV